MFNYTIAAFKKTVKDCENLLYWTGFFAQIVYLVYLLYAIFTSAAIIQIINICLGALSLAYFIFFLVLTKAGKDKDAQKKGKVFKEVFAWIKRAVRLYTLGVMVFGIFQTIKTVSPLSVILSVLMVATFILEIAFALMTYIVKTRLSIFLTAIMHDIRPVTETTRNVGNFFKRLKGEETEPEPILSELDEKNLEILTPLVEEDLEERREREETRKQQKKAEKTAKRAERAAKRAAKKKKTVSADEETAATDGK